MLGCVRIRGDSLQELASKEDSSITANGWRFQTGSNDALQVLVGGSGTSFWNYVSTNAVLTGNTWQFLGFTFNSSNAATEAIQIYRGTLTSAVAEVSYSARTDGTAPSDGDAASNLEIGNWIGFGGSFSFQGRIAWVGIWNRELTAAEVAALRMRPRCVKSNGCVFSSHLGWAGTGTQPDLSGNGNNGTVTGATVAPHVPVARWP